MSDIIKQIKSQLLKAFNQLLQEGEVSSSVWLGNSHIHLHLVIYQTLLSKATYKGDNSQAKSNKKHGVTINTTLHKN